MFKCKEVVIDELRVFYWVYSIGNREKGETLVVLPGWMAHPRLYFNIFLSSDFAQLFSRIIVLDWPGFGQSDDLRESWGIEEYGCFLKKFIKKICPSDNLIILGHSFGGSVSVWAVDNGLAVNKLVLVAPSIVREDFLKQKIKKFLFKIIVKISRPLFFVFAWAPKPFLEKVKERFYHFIGSDVYLSKNAVMKETFQKVVKSDLQDNFKNIKIPIFLIWGENDRATPLKHARILDRLSSCSRLYVINKSGHFPFLDFPHRFGNILRSILN